MNDSQHPSYPGAEHDAAWRRLVCPADYANPTPKPRYHLAVIGAGPAGLVTAIAAAGLGAKVALIEKKAMGGDCLNVGCVPSKSLLEFTAHGEGHADFDAAFAWLRRVRAGIAPNDSVERYRDAGVDVFFGNAKFRDEQTVSVAGLDLSARRTVVATGSRAAMPPVAGLADAKPLTNETLFDLEKRPERLAILGAGPVGCELAQAFARLGVDVHLLEMGDRILNSEHADASDTVAAALGRCGVTVRTGTRVARVERRGTSVWIDTGGEPITADTLVVAAGRRANTDELNLAAVGVQTSPNGLVEVDKYLRTTNSKIYAAGDVCSKLQFTHHADAQARIVIQNALFVPSATTRKLVVPRCTYTAPEVAQIGPTPAELERRGTAFDTYRVAFGELDRGRTQGDEEGFAELLTSRGTGTLLGATIVGRDAGEQIASVCVAMANGLGLDAFAKTVFAYPTRAEYLRRIADTFNRTRLTGRTKALMGHWLRLRG